MTTRLRLPAITLLILTMFAGGALAQQKPPAKPTTTPAPVDQTPDRRDYDDAFYRRPTMRLFQNYTLPPGDATREVLSILADVTIDGTVRGDVGVVMGSATIGANAVIEGSLVVVGGGATVASGAKVGRDIVVIGGILDAPLDFVAGGEHVVIGTPVIGEALHAMTPWLTRGILLGRLIVYDIYWNWIVVGVLFLFGLFFNHVFARQVGACADTLARRPVGSFFVGMLTIFLAGPFMMIVAMTVIGLPFAIAAMMAASIIGKLAVTRMIGRSVFTERDPRSRAQAFRSYLIGAAILIVAFMMPILGLMTWALIGVFGFGTATMTFLASMRKERPSPTPGPPGLPVAPPPVAPPPPAAPPPSSFGPEPVAFNPEPAPPPAALSSFVDTPAAVSEPAAAFTSAPAASDPSPPQPAAPESAGGVAAGDLRRYPRASFLDRLVAFALDAILVAIVNGWLVAGYFTFGRGPDNTYLAMLFLYHLAFWAWKGTTLGGIICNLRMVRTTGETPRFIDALVRALSAIFSVAALFIGCLWMLSDPERQMWHDKFAGTVVVKVPREVVLA